MSRAGKRPKLLRSNFRNLVTTILWEEGARGGEIGVRSGVVNVSGLYGVRVKVPGGVVKKNCLVRGVSTTFT